jgi:ribA/ribD-fused uncharacterized protein
MIKSFSGDYRFLSNFYPVEVVLDGVTYPTVENAYQAAKTLDLEKRQDFLGLTPGAAKRLGQRLGIRPDWDDVKLSVMTRLNEQKYMQPDLRKKLCDTYPQDIVEGNTWGDTFWGVCDGKGSNHLGKILMAIRMQILIDDIRMYYE